MSEKGRFHCFLAETMEAAFRSLIRHRPRQFWFSVRSDGHLPDFCRQAGQ